MKRHPALQPLSRDHHHGLVEARRLRKAGRAGPAARVEAARAFLRFFDSETRLHFREEEELVFCILDPPPDAVVQGLVEHARIHGLVARLRLAAARGAVDGEQLSDLGALMEAHIRLEEREIFPLIEEGADPDALAALELPDRGGVPSGEGPVVDLAQPAGTGPLWGTATADLNATLLAWEPGGGTPEHVNDERDVLLVVLDGWGTVEIGGVAHTVGPQQALVVEKGSSRRITAGNAGIRYLSVHLRRPGLRLQRLGG